MNENESQSQRGPFTTPPRWLVILWCVLLAWTLLPLEGPATVGAYLFAEQYGRTALVGAATAGYVLAAWTRRNEPQ